MVNDVDQLSRDCDLLDDGNAANGSCGSECPDGIVQQDESCDDGNATDNDGCSDHCTIEGGWACTGEPSTCTRKCGDGALDAGESCDDANLTNGDGCNNACDVENGYECSGAPSVCQKKCGNGTVDVANGEICDDHNHANGDGCSSTCQVEAPLPGDANGDFTLSPEDREFAVTEIFDGDGDTVGTVSGGTFAGSVGVDANDDGFVTAADLVAITKLLSP